MSCWVVPSIAAEFWGISLAAVLERIKAGGAPAKSENGFTFVDVAPDSPRFERNTSPISKPETFTLVSQEERDALLADEPEIPGDEQWLEEVLAEHDGEGDHEEAVAGTIDWRSSRLSVGQTRRAPLAA